MKRKTKRVAVVLELQTNYRRHTDVYVGAQMFAEEHDWQLIIDEFADETLASCNARTTPYDGVIARATKRLAEEAERCGVPVVNVWLASPVRDKLPGVFPDFAALGTLAAEHLLTRGLCRFAAISSSTISHSQLWEAYERTILEMGYPVSHTKVPLVPTRTLAAWQKTQQAIAAAIDTWELPIGVWVGTEHVGRLVAQECGNRGIRIPEDVAIIAGLNEETFCMPKPSLTTIQAGIERVGYEAARILHDSMQTQSRRRRSAQLTRTDSPLHMLLPPAGLILRESTDFLAVEDEVVAAALEFIAANSHRPIDVEQVARSVASEPRTLQRRFRKHLKRPIATEIRRIRIERAKRELTQSNRSIAEIARTVGFGESMRMYEVFRRELGVTPSEYRKQRRVSPET